MSGAIHKEMLIPRPPAHVWRAIAERAALAEWMFPNDFEPRVGHRFAFHVPPNPGANFEGLVVRCEVLECDPPSRLTFSWSAGGPVEDTRVTFRLEPEGTVRGCSSSTPGSTSTTSGATMPSRAQSSVGRGCSVS